MDERSSSTPWSTKHDEFLAMLLASRLVDGATELAKIVEDYRSAGGSGQGQPAPLDDESALTAFADYFVARGVLTKWQCDQLMCGNYHGFTVGLFRLLRHVPMDASPAIYLAENLVTKRRTVLEVTPHDYPSRRGVAPTYRVLRETDGTLADIQTAVNTHLRGRQWVGLLSAGVWLAFVAGMLSFATEVPLVAASMAVVVIALVCSGLGLAWATLWARRKDTRLGQFGIGSLLFLTAFAAIFFAAVRWIVILSAPRNGRLQDYFEHFAAATIVCLMVSVISIPFLVRMTESLVWAAAWAIKRPTIRRYLAARFRRNAAAEPRAEED